MNDLKRCSCFHFQEHLIQRDAFCPQHREIPLVHEDKIRALQDDLAELKSVVVLAMDKLTSNHEVFWILDDYDGSGDSIRDLVQHLAVSNWEVELLGRQRDRLLAHCNMVEAIRHQTSMPLAEIYEIMITDPGDDSD